jgi:nucleoside-diphosphate-sugar epimerase
MMVLILGGTRLSGPYLVSYLVEQGHRVTVFNRGQNLTEGAILAEMGRAS